MIKTLVYRSLTDLTPSDAAYRHILVRAWTRNQNMDVTGYLHWEDGIFHQWNEGPATELLIVEQIILADRSHRDVTIINRSEVSGRAFEGFSMVAGMSHDSPLFNFMAQSGAANHDHLAYAQSVLQFMKQQLSQHPPSRRCDSGRRKTLWIPI